MDEPRATQPLEMKVNPRKWTTRVNIALVIGVTAVLLVGAAYLVYALFNTQEVRDDVHDDVAPNTTGG